MNPKQLLRPYDDYLRVTAQSALFTACCSDRSRHAASDSWIWQSRPLRIKWQDWIAPGRQDNSASGMLPASICFKPGEDRVRTENRVCIQNHPRHRVSSAREYQGLKPLLLGEAKALALGISERQESGLQPLGLNLSLGASSEANQTRRPHRSRAAADCWVQELEKDQSSPNPARQCVDWSGKLRHRRGVERKPHL